MEGIKYTKEIRDAVQLVEDIVDSDPGRAVPLIEGLLKKTEKYEDPQLRADLYYHLGSAYFDLHNSGKSSKNIVQALGYYRKLQDWEKLAQCYNLLGISYTYQGDGAGSIDAFTSELDLGEDHGMLLAQMKAYINLATTCYEIGRFADAIYYSDKAINIFKDHEDKTQVVNYRIVYLSIYSKAQAHQGHYDEAEEALRQLETQLADYPQFLNTPFDRLPRFLLKVSKDHEKIDPILLDDEMGMYMEPGFAVDYVYETIEFMSQLEKLGEYERLNQMITVLGDALASTDFYGYKLQQSRFKINYCQHIHDKDALADEIGTYCDYVDMQRQITGDAMISYLRARASLRSSEASNMQLRKTNLRLRKRANSDELTQIWNRRGLNEVSDQLFEHARRCGENFGFEMFDIDFFKDVNDQYGHDVGDQCLMAVADALRELQSETVLFARYGGDEFVMIYLGHSDEEIVELASRLSERVKQITADRKLPELTISQGICNRVPGEKDRLWDFSSAADMALYHVKASGRGALRIVGEA